MVDAAEAVVTELDAKRTRMVDAQLAGRGIRDARILAAFRAVPREAFVEPSLVDRAYEDGPLPIGDGQTISQPYIVALSIEALQLAGNERVLEVGAGSGYALAILSRIAREVIGIERLPQLAERARTTLERLGCSNVRVLVGDGSLGSTAHAPYDAIIVSAGGPRVPDALRAQLAIGGRLVIPVGPSEADQRLLAVTRTSGSAFRETELASVRFVRLIGAQAFGKDEGREAIDRPR